MSSTLSGECNSYTREVWNEGYHTCKYLDSKGIPTIGVGFNLHKSGARQKIESVGGDFEKVLEGYQCLSENQIIQLFNEDMETAVKCATSWIGPNWSIIEKTRQSAVADMAFNLGCGRLQGFRRLKKTLSSWTPDYAAAVHEMRDSLWCKQVKSRCNRNIKCMR